MTPLPPEVIHGLTTHEADARIALHGPNALPEVKTASVGAIFIRQFLNPLIYILFAAAAVSIMLGDVTDACFIGIVLLLNGTIGAIQEYSANKAASALRKLEQPHATVIRDGKQLVIESRELVPGDVVLLEAGNRVPADIALFEATDFHCDEASLTGESYPVRKDVSGEEAESNAFAGTVITRGRAQGTVQATGLRTRIGQIAEQVQARSITQPPLMIRMKRFTRNIAYAMSGCIVFLILAGLWHGMAMQELFMTSVGLAVAAIPEGLPIAISVALAISMRRMARVGVIVRNMPAVESLGSCTMIATDKTGTLTLNELTVTHIFLPDGTRLTAKPGADSPFTALSGQHSMPDRLFAAASLPNEAKLLAGEDGITGMGDTVDIALLHAARKSGVHQHELLGRFPLAGRIPYEPDLRYAASFHHGENKVHIFVKGAPEALIDMADRMADNEGDVSIDRSALLKLKDELTSEGLRVLAFAEGEITEKGDGLFGQHHLVNLTFLGMVGMQDPIRPEVPGAIAECKAAGIEVVMVTGDDPKTATVIARQAGLTVREDAVITGAEVRIAEQAGEQALDALTARARIYARVEPSQKLAIVLSLARTGHFVAVTGDGVNDAPALKHAHVGVAMGQKGTDVAKESADIILTDDNFASIVHGIREGRIAYANIRKVIFMLISTGAAEVALFILSLLAGMPMPLLAVQLLWLNLVTNGVQDVALACEKAEGDELNYPPRRPGEPIFDRIMLRRILHSTLVMGGGGFAVFYWLIDEGYAIEEARNLLLMLFVLFENFQVLNSRSEHHSLFRQRFLSNPFLIFSIIAAQGLHIAAMYIPGLREVLTLSPIGLEQWTLLLLLASVLLIVMEIEKWWDKRR